MSEWQCAADAAVAGLVAMAGKVSGPVVYDSIVVTASGSREAIVVAGSADPRETARAYIEHKFDRPEYGPEQDGLFTVWSEIAVLDGSSNVSKARARCYVILRDWGRQIAEDPTLGGAVDSAWVSEAGCTPYQTTSGAKVVLLVGIDCQEFTRA